MVLRLSNEELDLMRTALRNEHARLLDEFADLHCVGYSPVGIKLCQMRSVVEAMLHQLDHPQADLSAVALAGHDATGANKVTRMPSALPWQDEIAA